MADNGGADPVNNNNDTTVGLEGTIIKVTVKTPKDKEEIAISEDASVTQVRSFCESVIASWLASERQLAAMLHHHAPVHLLALLD